MIIRAGKLLDMQQIKDIESVFTEAHDRDYPKGQILLYQGEKTNSAFRIKTGYIKMYDITASGEEKLLLILGPGDVFPLIWLFDSSDPLHYFYESITDVKVSVIERAAFVEHLKSSHAFSLHMLQYFVERTSDIMYRLECIEATSAKHKVAQVLAYLAKSHGEEIAQCTNRVRVPTTHQMIADMAGLNRSTASIQMKELEDEKMYKDTANGGFIIHTDRITEFLEKQD